MLNEADERDEDRDENDSDADRDEDKNSDDQEGDYSDDNEDEESDDDESDDDSDEDDDKPMTRKEILDLLRKQGNDKNANRRVRSKGRNDQNDRDRGSRHTSQQSPKLEERLSNVEKLQRQAEVSERKRSFGFENNLSPAQVDVVFRMTKRPTRKFLDTPYVKAALDTIAQQSNVRDNTPSGSGRGSFKSSSGKSWDKMDAQEKQQNFADRRRAILASKK